MVTKFDLEYVSARVLIYEYRNAMNKIQFYEDKIATIKATGKASDSKRYNAPLLLFQKHKANLELEATRRNMPIDELTGIKE